MALPDYRELWSSLGVDLQKHDQLCAALPDLYGRVFLTDDDRPQGMNYFTAVVAEIHGLRIQELAEHRRAGGKVLGTFCVFVPEEVILAADAVAVGLCSGSHFWVPDGERVLPRNTCPLIKASLGAALGRTCPYFLSCDLLVGETTCDGKKKTWEILAEYLPVHVMHLPQMKRERDVAAWKQEIGLFLDRVQQLSGRYITAEGLGRAIRLANQKRGVLRRLYEARKAEPVPINGKDALLVSQIAFFDDPARFVSQTEVLCRELEARIEERRGALPRGTPRILVTGTPMAIPNWKLHHVIESSGGAVVCEETCTGTRYFENPVSEDGDTIEEQLEALTRRYMSINCACFTPNRDRIQDILRLVREYRVDGVIYCTLQFCHTYNIEGYEVEKVLKREDIPVLRVETDYSEEDVGQLHTRVEAFMEVLHHRNLAARS